MHESRVSGMIISMHRRPAFVTALLVVLLFAVAATAPSSAAMATQPTWYAVELVVFAHRDDATEDEERWSPDPGVPDVSATAPLVPPTIPDSLRAFEQLRPTALTMSGAVRTLERSSRYRTLVHFGWMQPGLARELAVPVDVAIETGLPLAPLPLEIELPDPEPEESPPEEAAPEDIETEAEAASRRYRTGLIDELKQEYAAPPEPEPLTGTVRLVLQRFLHVELDLMLESRERLPEPEEGDWFTRRDRILDDFAFGEIGPDEARARLDALNAEPRFQRYRLRESRRVRTDELHYFDHPKFGAIVRVVEVPEDEIEARKQVYDEALERALRERSGGPGSGQPR